MITDQETPGWRVGRSEGREADVGMAPQEDRADGETKAAESRDRRADGERFAPTRPGFAAIPATSPRR